MQSLSASGAAALGKIMIVEDELLIAYLIIATLEEAGYNVCGMARNVSEAVALARLHSPDLAVIDLKLEDNELGTDIAPQLGGAHDGYSLCERQYCTHFADDAGWRSLPFEALPYGRSHPEFRNRGRIVQNGQSDQTVSSGL